MAAICLTGEHRPYRTERGIFGGIQPKNNFGSNGGWGAWEVAARYSHIDLNDKGVGGGELGDFTFGMNWYLNPNVRFMFNYVHADLEDSGEANIIQSRFQVAF